MNLTQFGIIKGRKTTRKRARKANKGKQTNKQTKNIELDGGITKCECKLLQLHTTNRR